MDTMNDAQIPNPIGLIAGSGEFPLQFAKNARDQGIDVIALAHTGETRPELRDLVHQLTWVKLGQLGKIIRILKKGGVQKAVMLGGIEKVSVFENVRPDWHAVKMLARIRSTKDDALLRGIAGVIEGQGISIIAPSILLPESTPCEGVLTVRGLTETEVEDALLGWQVSQSSGELDVGQSVVVHRGITIAVEAVEGTDRMIERSGQLIRGEGGVLVKLAKPHQDLRLDLPAIGPNTISNMKDAGLKALVIQEGKALILKPEEVRRAANEAGIAFIVARDRESIERVSLLK
jgi:DUF1009 family protein